MAENVRVSISFVVGEMFKSLLTNISMLDVFQCFPDESEQTIFSIICELVVDIRSKLTFLMINSLLTTASQPFSCALGSVMQKMLSPVFEDSCK
jgi:hypothetical protein